MLDLDLTEVTEVTNIASLEAELAALDEEIVAQPDEAIEELMVEDEIVEAAAVDEDAELSEILDDDLLADLEIAATKQSLYESQAAETMPDIAETVDGTTAASIKTKKARTTSKTTGSATPRAPRDLAAVPGEFFDLFTDSNLTTADDFEAAKKGVMAKRPGQVKIAEKFDNLFMQVAAGRKPSTYVMQALDLLASKGEFSSTDLIAHYRANGLGDGTARSQTGQIMVLFDVTGIATRVGQKMTGCKNSKLVERINAMSAVPTAA